MSQSSSDLFRALVASLRTAPDAAPKRIAAMVEQFTGRPISLAVFHGARNIPESDKVKLYQTLLDAIQSGNWPILEAKQALTKTPSAKPALAQL